MMRLFIALEPSAELREALVEVQNRLRAAGVAARYYGPAQLHMTLAFIGQWPQDITALLPAVEQPFPVVLSRLGVFPRANVLWAGVKPCDALEQLAERVRHALEEAAIPFDHQPFCPHITLGRKPVIPEGMRLAEIAVPPAAMTVRQVCLYRSERGENGMVYTVIGRGASAASPREESK